MLRFRLKYFHIGVKSGLHSNKCPYSCFRLFSDWSLRKGFFSFTANSIPNIINRDIYLELNLEGAVFEVNSVHMVSAKYALDSLEGL